MKSYSSIDTARRVAQAAADKERAAAATIVYDQDHRCPYRVEGPPNPVAGTVVQPALCAVVQVEAEYRSPDVCGGIATATATLRADCPEEIRDLLAIHLDGGHLTDGAGDAIAAALDDHGIEHGEFASDCELADLAVAEWDAHPASR